MVEECGDAVIDDGKAFRMRFWLLFGVLLAFKSYWSTRDKVRAMIAMHSPIRERNGGNQQRITASAGIFCSLERLNACF